MKTLFLLVILTQNGAGDFNAAFVNTETLEQCQQKAAMLKSVFSATGIPAIENRCIKSALQFSEFNHISIASKIQNYYKISVTDEMVDVAMMPDWRTCMAQQKKNTAQNTEQGKVYCSSSAQSLL